MIRSSRMLSPENTPNRNNATSRIGPNCAPNAPGLASTIKAGDDELRFDEKPLEDKMLYLCFRDDEQGQTLKHIFNADLEGADAEAIVDGYFATAFE